MNKSDFPIFQNRPELVYLDNSATSQKPQSVIDAIKHYYENSNANVHRGIYKLSEEATGLYEQSRELAAVFFNTKPEQIIFTAGATTGLNFVSLGYAPLLLKPNSDETILTSVMEHHSNLLPWQQLSIKTRTKLEFVRLTDDYRLDLEDLRHKLKTNKVKILALTHMSNVLGTINPLSEIVQITREVSPLTKIVIDGAQYAPHFKLDLSELDVDFYCIAGHKMLGPTGTGILWGKKELLEQMEPPFSGGGMIRKVERSKTEWAPVPEKFEAGTPNIAGVIGLGEAIRYLGNTGMSQIVEHEKELTAYALAHLTDIPGLTLFGPKDVKDRGAVFSFTIEGIHPHDLAQLLDEHNIAVRAGHHCNQILMREVLEVSATTRASFYLYNDYKDIDKLIDGIKKAKNIFRGLKEA